MGMFDTVVIEGLKLPKLPKEVSKFLATNNSTLPNDYQTKDLDSLLETYFINKDGQIFKNVAKATGKKIAYISPFTSWKVNEPLLIKVFRKTTEKKFNVPRFIQHTKSVRQKTHLTNTFEIYSYKEAGGRYLDISYKVTAVDGKVKKVSLGTCQIESEKSAQERHDRDAEWQVEHMQKTQEKLVLEAKWYYPILREVYNPAVFFASLAVQKICGKLVQCSYRWRGV